MQGRPLAAVEVPRAIPNTRILTWTLGCYEPSVVNVTLVDMYFQADDGHSSSCSAKMRPAK